MPANRADILKDQSIDHLIRRIPPSLFKYSGLSGDRLEWMRRLIVESDFYFPKPSSFNDPLDCRVPARFEASSLAVEAHWRSVAQELFPKLPKQDRKARVRALVKASRTTRGRAELTEKLFGVLAKNGTACFATDPTSMLMWSYYAEGHTGIAIRFGTDVSGILAFGKAINAQGSELFPVQVRYSEDFPDCNYYTATTHERLKVLLGTKSAEWKHEGEWRFVLPHRHGYFKIPRSPVVVSNKVVH